MDLVGFSIKLKNRFQIQISVVPNRFIMDLDSVLIKEIKSQPVLYDSSDPMYKDVDHKQKIWMDIGKKIMHAGGGSSTVSALKVRWKTLRDAYVKERKHDLVKTRGINVKPKRPWGLKKELEFLAPFIQMRQEFSDYIVESEEFASTNCQWEKNQFNGTIGDDTGKSKSFVSDDVKKSKRMTDVGLQVEIETNLFNEPISSSDDERFIEINSFFRDMANAVKYLSHKNQMMIEKEITKLILGYKLKELEEQKQNI